MKKIYYNHYEGIFGETPEAVAKALAQKTDFLDKKGILMGLVKINNHYKVAICRGDGKVRSYVIDVAVAV